MHLRAHTSVHSLIILQVTLEALRDWSDLKPSVSHFVRRYQEERGERFSLDISTDVLKHLVKLHRALKFTRYV